MTYTRQPGQIQDVLDALAGIAAAANSPTDLTDADGSTVDATYGAEEQAVIQNLVTRQAEIAQVLIDAGLLTDNADS